MERYLDRLRQPIEIRRPELRSGQGALGPGRANARPFEGPLEGASAREASGDSDTEEDRVPVDLGSESRPVGEPQVLFRPKIRRDMYEAHPDGDRFLVVTRIDPEIDRAILVDDWDSP